MPDATFACPDLTTFCRLDELGLEAIGQRLELDRAVLACRVVEPDQWCRRCGFEGAPRDSVVRKLAHEPLGWRPTMLEVVVRRYRCTGCGHVWRQDTTKAAEPRAKLSRGLRWALEAIVVQHLTVARVADGLGVAWNTANDAVLAEGKRVLIDDEHRFDGVTAIGVDEHVWRHTRRGDKYVTVIIDLTAVRAGTGPARLLDMAEGRSKQAFKTWLAERPEAWRDAVEVVAMDGFTGFKTATVEELPDVRGHGPLPRRAPGRRRAGPVPTARATGHRRPPRPQGRPPVHRSPDPAHRRRPPHRQADRPPGRTVRRKIRIRREVRVPQSRRLDESSVAGTACRPAKSSIYVKRRQIFHRRSDSRSVHICPGAARGGQPSHPHLGQPPLQQRLRWSAITWSPAPAEKRPRSCCDSPLERPGRTLRARSFGLLRLRIKLCQGHPIRLSVPSRWQHTREAGWIQWAIGTGRADLSAPYMPHTGAETSPGSLIRSSSDASQIAWRSSGNVPVAGGGQGGRPEPKIDTICKMRGVSRSDYYGWLSSYGAAQPSCYRPARSLA